MPFIFATCNPLQIIGSVILFVFINVIHLGFSLWVIIFYKGYRYNPLYKCGFFNTVFTKCHIIISVASTILSH